MAVKHTVTDDQYQVISKLVNKIEHRLRQEGGRPLDPESVAWTLQQLVNGKHLVLADEDLVGLATPAAILTVPDLPPPELVALVERTFKKYCPLETRHWAFSTWNFYQYRAVEGEPRRTINVRGKHYEVASWKPRKCVRIDEIRQYFKDLGRNRPFPVRASRSGRYIYRGGPDKFSQDFAPFDGNTGAFLVCSMEDMSQGKRVSIPSEDGLLWHDTESKRLHAPCSHRYTENRGFYNTFVDSSNLRLIPVDGEFDDTDEFVAFRELPSE